MRQINEFTDYREWVRAWMEARPRQRSQRELARRLGITSSLVNMILKRKRTLPVDEAPAWGAAMNLAGEDLAHWIAMVRAAHGSESERYEAEIELRARGALARAWRLPIEDDAFASWHTWAVLELARCPGFVAEAAWVAGTLRPPIGIDEAQRALDALLERGFLLRTPEGVRVETRAVAMPEEADRVRIERIKRLHRDQLAYAATALEHPAHERHVVSIVFAAPRAALDSLRERLDQAVRKAVESTADLGPPDQVFQVSLQILPRSEGKR